MRQVVVIGGGDSFTSYEEYFSRLRGLEIASIDFFKSHRSWKQDLEEALGDGYEVLAPSMPNKQNAKYAEWQIWFEKLTPFLEDGVVLIGHSLGASFLTRYLSENDFPRRIAATMLVAGAYSADLDEMAEEFAAPGSLDRLAKQGGIIFLYHSTDDPVVPFSELARYQAALPRATVRIFDDRQHFNQETFPELVADIKSVM